VTVLRDGRFVRSAAAAGETVASLVTSMLNRSLDSVFPPLPVVTEDAPVVLSVRHLTRRGVVDDISVDVHAGEIVGIAGLVGSGRSEFVRAIFGADRADSGVVSVAG